MKKLGLFIIVGLLSMTIPQMNANTFTVQAATIKKVTGIKKNRVKDGSYFYSKKKYYDGCYRKISWKKIKKVSGYQVYRYDYYLKKWNRVLTTKNNYFKITDMCEGEKVKLKFLLLLKLNHLQVHLQFLPQLCMSDHTDSFPQDDILM